jgi:hypothetical protein
VSLVRTNITLPEETLALVDAVAGPRGRSRYIADVVARQVRRDNARMVFEKYAGFLKDSDTWGRTPDETLQIIRDLRDDGARERGLRGEDQEVASAVSAGHDRPDRPCHRQAGGRRARSGAVQRTK